MEPLAFVEVVDRHGDVLSRHPVYRWPVKVGRAYGNDVIVDDAFVAALHLAIEAVGDGRFVVSDNGTLNGVYVAPSDQRLSRSEIGPDDIVRIGHTQLRVRTPGYAVPQERVMRAVALYRRPVTFVAAAALLVSVFAWNVWIMTSDEEERYAWLGVAVGMLVMMAVWIAGWAFASGTMGRRPTVSAHGVIACAGAVGILLAESFFDYLSFAVDASWMTYAGTAIGALVFAGMIYRHLLLNSRAARRKLMLVAGGVTTALYAASFGLELAFDYAQQGKQRYVESIKAPVFLLASGTSLSAFMTEAQSLKIRVDAMAKDRDRASAKAKRD